MKKSTHSSLVELSLAVLSPLGAALALALVSPSALAQPAGSGSAIGSATAPAGSGSGSVTGSAASAAGSASSAGSNANGPVPITAAGSAAAAPVDPNKIPVGAPEARKACADAMNADPAFAAAIARTADMNAAVKRDEAIVAAHKTAADDIALNEKHVIMAYAAMWLLSIIFVIFLWRKQGSLRTEIATLKNDLEAATKSPTPRPAASER